MAVTLINLTGYQWGVESNEVGINVRSFGVTYRPEFKEFLQNKQNEKIGFALGDTEAEISVEGEVSSAAGLMAASFASAVTLANDHNEFGMSTGGIFLDEVTVNQERGGWRGASFKFTKNKGVT